MVIAIKNPPANTDRHKGWGFNHWVRKRSYGRLGKPSEGGLGNPLHILT